MSSRTVKFSDLLTRPMEFAPIEAPPSPSSQLDTLSSTDSSSEEEPAAAAPDAPAETSLPSEAPMASTTTPDEAAPTSAPAADPKAAINVLKAAPATNVLPSDSEAEEVPKADAVPGNADGAPPLPGGSPPPAIPEGLAEQTSAVPTTSSQAHAVEPAPSPDGLQPGPQPPMAEAASSSPAPEITSSAPPTTASSPAPTTASPPSQTQPTEPTPIPPLPPAEGSPGSIFNLPGLQKAFPMRPTALPGFSLVSASEAEEAARRLGLQTPKNFSVPSATRLPDGSVVLAAPATAVSMARVSASCSAALSDPAARPLADEVLRLIDAFRRNPGDDTATAKLTEALRRVDKSQMLSCDPALAGAVGEARTFFGKLQAAVGHKTSAELTYMKHAEEFRAMKKDLKALSDVVHADGLAVTGARDKVEAFKKKRLPQAAASLYVITSRLRQLRDLSERLRG